MSSSQHNWLARKTEGNRKSALTRFLVCLLTPLAIACSRSDSAEAVLAFNEANPHFAPSALTTMQTEELPADFEGQLGFYVHFPKQERYDFFEWESETTLNDVLWDIKYKPGAHIYILPGTYEIEQRIFVNEIPDLKISGLPGVRFVFAEGADKLCGNSRHINEGDTEIYVEDTSLFNPEWRYQIYAADGRGDRILEFEVTTVHEDHVKLRVPAHFMPHVKGVPKDSQIMEQLNMFRVRRCPNFILENVEMDGRNRGGIRGHTIYSGIYATGLYKAHERATTLGFEVRGCVFKNLKGRGVVFYGMADCLIQNNYFENIRAQAIEIDHFSSGHILGNYVNGAEVGVMVNDAYESIVESNILTHCKHAVRFLEIYNDEWVNSGNIIRDNQIGPGCRGGIVFFNEGMTDNQVVGNRFLDIKDGDRVVRGEGNIIDLAPPVKKSPRGPKRK